MPACTFTIPKYNMHERSWMHDLQRVRDFGRQSEVADDGRQVVVVESNQDILQAKQSLQAVACAISGAVCVVIFDT